MARNGSGTYSVPNSFSANTTIESAKVNQNFTDVGSEITGSLPRNGEAGMTGQFKAADGTSSLPGITFSSDTDTGFYRSAANTIGVAGTLTTDGTNKVDAFPAGTALLFQQTNAPTGWTKSTTHNNKALRVVSGTASSGGTTAFTSVFAARTIAQANLPNVTLSYSGTTGDDTVNHTHSFTYDNGSSTVSLGGSFARVNSIQTSGGGGGTVTTGGVSTPHQHAYSGNTSSINGGVTQQTIDFAVQYVDVVICTKDA